MCRIRIQTAGAQSYLGKKLRTHVQIQ
eukprot:SAG31_NODE_15671_length_743_cov_1.436335_2_plen_26_part_01